MKLTTRRAVIFGLLVVQAVSLLALFFVSGRIAANAESDHQNALLNTESAEAIDRMRAHIQPAESVVAFSTGALEDESVTPSALRDSFRVAMETSPQLDGVFVGSPDGSFLFVSRFEDGYRVKEIYFVDGERRTSIRDLDADGREFSASTGSNDEYNPVLRPWYQQAVTNLDEVSWTEPYVFFTSRQLGITAAAPIVRDGEIVGVVGADIELGSLSRFLTSLDTGTNGGSVIVNEDGLVIAHPDPQIIQRMDGDSFTTVAVAELEDDLARAAIASYVEQGAEGGPQLTEFVSEQFGDSRGSFRTVNVGTGDWTVAVFGPQDSLVGGLASARATERTLLGIASVLGLLLLAALFTRATKPIDELEKNAWSDSLTGLPNRRNILRAVDREIAETKDGLSVAMLDIDNFKLVNDTYGHQVGDEVLSAVASRAARSLPEGSTIGRIGGEEFLVLMRSCGASSALKICEEVRRTVRETPVQNSAGALDVTVSLGLAASRGHVSRDHLISLADAALLEAKSAGRDRVVSADDDADRDDD